MRIQRLGARVRGGLVAETRTHKNIMTLSSACVGSLLFVPALDCRFRWLVELSSCAHADTPCPPLLPDCSRPIFAFRCSPLIDGQCSVLNRRRLFISTVPSTTASGIVRVPAISRSSRSFRRLRPPRFCRWWPFGIATALLVKCVHTG